MVGTRERSSRAAVPSPSSDSTRYSDIGLEGGVSGATSGRGGLTIPVLLNEAQKSSLGPGQVRLNGWPAGRPAGCVVVLGDRSLASSRLALAGSVRIGAVGPTGE